MQKKTFLFELGVEEFPEKKLYKTAISFYEYVKNTIISENISYKTIKWFATSRRISIKIEEIFFKDKKIEIIQKGPSIINAFNTSGKPTIAALSWAKKINIKLSEASQLKNNLGNWLIYKKSKKQENLKKKLIIIIEKSIKKISVGKLMKWNESNQKFFRPIRSLTMLLDNTIIPCCIFNINSNRTILGHRTLGQKKISIQHAKEYPNKLIQQGFVIPCFKQRKKIILEKIKIFSEKMNFQVKIDNSLLDEVTSLVEYPIVYLAKFNKKFLFLPSESLIYTMEKEQKYFPIYKNKKIVPYFIFISNTISNNSKKIIENNEQVLNSRLSDAKFFFYQDQKINFNERLNLLKNVSFQKKLGTLFEKTQRLKKLSVYIAKLINANVQQANIAASMSKYDLVTNMVTAYPQLQGIIGMHYAIKSGIEEKIAIAIKEHYKPTFSGDKIPNSTIGCILSISDKIDLLTGMFGIGYSASSEKDPFSLKRCTIGIIRIINEKKLNINLKKLIKKSFSLHFSIDYNKNIIKKIMSFFFNRYLDWYKKNDYDLKIIKSVLDIQMYYPNKIDMSIKSISNFKNNINFNKIITLNKRISNILKQSEYNLNAIINNKYLQNIEEKNLVFLIYKTEKKIDFLYQNNEYEKLLFLILKISTPINNFFNENIINHKNDKIKLNRLNLLKKIQNIFLKIANFSML